MLVGQFTDWREGMETFARLQVQIAPRRLVHWNGPTPIGWNSWGAIQDKLTLDKVMGVINFLHDSCRLFRDAGGGLFIDLDSYWNKLVKGGLDGDVSQLKSFVAYCKQRGFRPGIYWTPFTDWEKMDRKVEGSAYSYQQTWTRVNGRVIDTDGGRAMIRHIPAPGTVSSMC
jgi:alpha-galactosidase